MKPIVAIGDVHGLEKWRSIVDEHEDCTIVFLGDYLDPYEYITRRQQLDNLRDIIELKKRRMDDVVLLLGNHDLHYFCDRALPGSRYDFQIERFAEAMFNANIELFQYAYQQGNRIFTHAGIQHSWFVDDFKGDLTQPIAHQLNNPIGGMLSHIQLLLMDMKHLKFEGKDELEAELREMEHGTRRCAEIVRDLLGFSRRADEDEAHQHDLIEIVRQAMKITELQTRSKGIRFKLELDPPDLDEVPIQGRFNLLAQAVRAILLTMLSGGLRDLVIGLKIVKSSVDLTVSIGPVPVPIDGRDRLDLTVARQILLEHGGRLDLENSSITNEIGKDQQVQRGHYFAIVDEVDSVLIDEARTPLIISGQVTSAATTHQYERYKPLIEQLVKRQNALCNSLISTARELSGAGDNETAGRKLFQVKLGQPKNRALLRSNVASLFCTPH